MAKDLELLGIRRQVLEDFGNDNPKPRDYDDWCRRESERVVAPERVVRNIIAKKIESFEIQVGAQRSTSAQKVADAIGASTARALRTILDALSANRKIVKGDAEKGFQEWDVPDWNARLEAADKILKVRGAYAPEKMEVSIDEYGSLSDDELNLRIAQCVAVYDSFRKIRTSGDASGAEGKVVSGRSVLLDDGGDANQGRARSPESIQAIPQETVSVGMPEKHS